MIKGIEQLLQPTPAGLYCPAGDFYIDPVRRVSRAIITHGHADHARTGHGAVLATAPTLAIMAARMGANFTGQQQAASFGASVLINDVKVSLHPAGHVLGSAQVCIERYGLRAVISGDYKRAYDPTCTGFEVIACDVFVTEATFGLPIFRHPPITAEIQKLLASISLFPDRAHFVGAYSLGKGQRMIAELRRAGYQRPIFIHTALVSLCQLYQTLNVDLGLLIPVGAKIKDPLKGEIVIGPPQAMRNKWIEQLADPVCTFASGWMRSRARIKSQGIELPLIISDHADWPELLATISDIAPQEVWITHGAEDALMRACMLNGITARPLHMVGYGGEDGDTEVALPVAPLPT